MKVTLEGHNNLAICSKAIRRCWASEGKSDTDYTADELICGEADKNLIDRIGNKFKHSSTLEHIYYNFSIEGVSRGLLQELARHRIASLSVESSRYTLKKLTDGVNLYFNESCGSYRPGIDWDVAAQYLVLTGDEDVDTASVDALSRLMEISERKEIGNDILKYCLPESYKTNLAWSINARSLQNFLQLRTSKSALWEIRDLANEIFNKLPDEHKYLFEDNVSKGE